MIAKMNRIKTVIREADGLRFDNFPELNGQQVTFIKLKPDHLIMEVGVNTETPVTHMVAAVEDGYARGPELMEFTSLAFQEKEFVKFVKSPGKSLDGILGISYIQYRDGDNEQITRAQETPLMKVTKEKSGLRFTNLKFGEHDRDVTILTFSPEEGTMIVLNGFVPQPPDVEHVHLRVQEDGFAPVVKMPIFINKAFRGRSTIPFLTHCDDSGKVKHFQANDYI